MLPRLTVDAVALNRFFERGHIILHPEQDGTGGVKLDVDIASSRPCVSHSLHDRYIAFCGAPAHLIGIGGCVNSAVP